MADETQFNEVLDIQVDLDKFRQQMAQVEEIYNNALKNLSGPQISNDAAIISTLQSIQQGFQKLAAGSSESLSHLTDTMLETANKVEQALNKIFDTEGTRASTGSQAEEEFQSERLTIAEKWALRRSSLEQKEYEQQAADYQALQEQLRNADDETTAQFSAKVAAHRDIFLKALREELAERQDQQAQLKSSDDETTAQFSAKVVERRAIFQKALKEQLEEQAEYQQQLKNSDDETTAQFTAAVAERRNIFERALKQQLAEQEATNKRFLDLSKQVNDVLAEYQSAQAKFGEKLLPALPPSLFDKKSPQEMAAAVDQVKTSIKAAGLQAAETKSEFDDFFGKLVRDIPGLIANVIRFQLAWAAVGAVINEIIGIPGRIVDVFKSGFEYLNTLEEQASQLKAALSTAEVFSEDPAKNLKLAAEEAERLTKRIQEMAITLQVNSKTIQAGFEKFIEFGGRNLTAGNDQALQLSSLAVAALQAQTPQLNIRTAGTELQKLVTGTLTDANKLPAAFGLSANQLNQMALHARTAHDLLDQIVAAAPGIADRIASAADRQAALTESLNLYKERLEGILAGDTFNAYTDFLKSTLKFLNDHKDEVDAIAAAWGFAAGTAVKDFFGLFQGEGELALTVLKAITKILLLLSEGFHDIASDTKVLISTFQILGETVSKLDFSKPFQSSGDAVQLLQSKLKKLAQQTEADDADYAKKLKERKAALDGLFNGTTTETPNTPKHGINNPNTAEELRALRDEYRERLEAIKTAESAERDAVDEAEHRRTISVQQAADLRIKSYENEKNAVIEAGRIITAQAQTLGLKPEQLASLESLVKRTDEAAQRIAGTATRKEKTKLFDLDNAKAEQDLQTQEQLVKDHLQAQLELERLYADEGLKTEEQVAQAELSIQNKIYEAEVDLVNKKIANAQKGSLQEAELINQRNVLEAQHADFVIAQQERIALAAQKQFLDEQQREEQRLALRTQELQAQLDIANAHGGLAPIENNQLQVTIAKSNVDEKAKAAADALQRLQQAVTGGHTPEEIRDLANSAKAAVIAWKTAIGQLDALQPGIKKGIQTLSTTLFGFDIQDTIQKYKDKHNQTIDTLGKVQIGLEAFTGALQNLPGLINQVQQGVQQGGTLGGIGAAAGIAGNIVSSFNPLAGAVVGAIGGIFSTIGGLFKKAAQDLAKHLKEEFDGILNAYNLGQASLFDTIHKLQQERNKAIQELSHKKGGKDELKKLLPQFDDEIAQLKRQQKDVKEAFETNLTILQSGHGSDVLQQWLSDWQGINKQVKDYIDAVGPTGYVAAGQFLTLTLQQKRKELQDQMTEAEQSAVQDALQLNDLLKQRNDLETNYKNTVFELETADSLARRTAGAVTRGREIQAATKQYNDERDALDYQIKSLTQRVDIERQVFNLSADTAKLRSQALDLELQKVMTQKQQWIDILNLIKQTASLVVGPNGQFLGTPLLTGLGPIPGFGATNPVAAPKPINVGNITINAYGINDPHLMVSRLENELRYRWRVGSRFTG